MKTKFMNWSACLVLMLLLTACNNSRMSSLLDKIPASVDVVAVGDLKTVLESAGGKVEGSKIELPDYITETFSKGENKDYDKFVDFLAESGINPSACALSYKYKDDSPMLIFMVDDEEAFVKAIKDEDFEKEKEQDGMTLYKLERYGSIGDYVAVKDGMAYFMERMNEDDKPMRTFTRYIENANEEDFGSTPFADYITEANAFGVSIKLPSVLKDQMKEIGVPNSVADIYDGVVCLRANLDQTKAQLKVKMFEKDGSDKNFDAVSKYFNVDAKVNADALKYLSDNESFVYAVSLKDVNWDKYFEMITGSVPSTDRATMAIVKSYLEKFDGTMAVGMGLTNGLTSVRNMSDQKEVMKEFPVTIVAEMKDGKAKSVVGDLKALLEKQGAPCTATSEGFSIALPSDAGTLYCEAKGNMLVLANHTIKEGNNNVAVKDVKWGNALGGMALVFEKNNALLKDLDVNSSLKIVTTFDKVGEATAEIEMDGDDSVGILGKFAKTLISLAKTGEDLAKKFYQPSYASYDSSAFDSDYADSDYSSEPDYSYSEPEPDYSSSELEPDYYGDEEPEYDDFDSYE